EPAAMQQVVRAYAVLLASQFQGFARDLYTECVDYLIPRVLGAAFQLAVETEFMRDRALVRGNANQATLGGDFARLGIPTFWTLVDQQDPGNHQRRQTLDVLNVWRNAIAHQDFDPAKLGATTTLRVTMVRAWRRACRRLARSIDDVMRGHIQHLTGTVPW